MNDLKHGRRDDVAVIDKEEKPLKNLSSVKKIN